MADKRITDLPLILSGDISSNDVLPIVNVEDDITNKIEISQLKSYILSGVTSGYTYEIGQYVQDQGGVIFHRYLDGNNQNYLVVALIDQSLGQIWSNIGDTLIGPSAQSLWDGLTNSNAIVGQAGFTNGAAKTCLDLILQDKNDWYLPSIQELNKLWSNYLEVSKTLSQTAGAKLLQPNFYWSSTEISNFTAYSFNFNYGTGNDGGKGNFHNVRAVRKFSV